ncbi:MAG: thrombospondin type 3 repeat-containing protein [Candidatus Falkowbacteria bacterium]
MATLANQKPVINPPSNTLTRKQKFGTVVFSLLGVIIFVFWYTQLKTNLYYIPLGGVEVMRLKATPVATSTQNAVDLTKDTDGDGLPDYMEINQYHTSPYLTDSDGDGISDYQEVVQSTDPNCAQGANCALGGLYGGGAVTSSVSTKAAFDITAAQQATIQKAFGEKPDPAVIRQSLLASASTDTDRQQISKLTDEQILYLYQQMLASIPVDATQPVAPAVAAPAISNQ